MAESDRSHKTNFIRNILDQDRASGKHQNIVLRFPPEPNGFLHIGHAKAICLNFGLAQAYGGTCHLRFDDTNPTKEEMRYIDAIKKDIQWLGFDWQEHLYFASDYFEQLYQLAVGLIKDNKAYVDDLPVEKMRAMRGNLTTPGENSPSRKRGINESLELFARMKAGEFSPGQYTLRAKIDMGAGNMNLRDPAIYRIMNATHPRTGETWSIYPLYDFAHALSDAIEGITHSLCSLEFQDHRPLYDWYVANCNMPAQPRQIEFSRLNLSYTLTSKRKLKKLVDEHHVDGWDDPRMPTLSGLKRRGYTARAIRNLCDHVGISKQDSVIDVSILEQILRDDLNQHAPRRMGVLKPLKVVITNYPQEQTEMLNVANHPQDESQGRRELPFSREIWIDQDDFMLDPPSSFRRLKHLGDVRLRNAYVITCDEILQDDQGKITQLNCTYHSETLGGKKPADGRKVKGIIHWVSAERAIDATVRLYDRLFNVELPGAMDNITDALNPQSLTQLTNAKLEPSLTQAKPGEIFQFTRVGYFCADKPQTDSPTFNLTVTLKDTYRQNKKS